LQVEVHANRFVF